MSLVSDSETLIMNCGSFFELFDNIGNFLNNVITEQIVSKLAGCTFVFNGRNIHRTILDALLECLCYSISYVSVNMIQFNTLFALDRNKTQLKLDFLTLENYNKII